MPVEAGRGHPHGAGALPGGGEGSARVGSCVRIRTHPRSLLKRATRGQAGAALWTYRAAPPLPLEGRAARVCSRTGGASVLPGPADGPHGRRGRRRGAARLLGAVAWPGPAGPGAAARPRLPAPPRRGAAAAGGAAGAGLGRPRGGQPAAAGPGRRGRPGRQTRCGHTAGPGAMAASNEEAGPGLHHPP